MPGALHLLFGSLLGLILWKLGEYRNHPDKTTQYRWNFSLVFVFIFNNHFGPDLGGLFHKTGIAIQSVIVYMFGTFVHSLLGWIIFAPIYAILMQKIAKSIDAARSRSLNKENAAQDLNSSEILLQHSYPMYLLATMMGGVFHFFMDTIGHYDIVDGGNYVRGKFPLYGGFTAGNLLIIMVLYCLALFSWLYSLKSTKKVDDPSKNLFEIAVRRLKNRDVTTGFFFFTLCLFNVLFLYWFLARSDLLLKSVKILKWTTEPSIQTYFLLGNSMHMGVKDLTGSATWWYAIWLIFLVFGVIIGYAKAYKIHIFNQNIRAEVMVLLIFACGIVLGYFLQPLIGNISGQEYDWGAFVFFWGLFYTPLWGLLSIKGTQNQ